MTPKTAVRLTRPFTLLPPLLGILSGAVCAFGSVHNPDPAHRVTPALLGIVALGALCASLLNAASNVLNQITDLEVDRINKPDRPLVTGEASVGVGMAVYGGSLPARDGPDVVDRRAGGARFRGARPRARADAPVVLPLPLRPRRDARLLRARVRTDEAPWRRGERHDRGPARDAPKVAGWTLVASAFSAEPWVIGGLFGLFLLGASSTKDFSDAKGDRAGGCETLPVKYGNRKAVAMISPFFVLPWLLLPALAWVRDPFAPAHRLLSGNPWLLTALGLLLAAWGAYTVRLLKRDPDELATTENHPSWTHMYLMLMSAQVGFALAYVF